MASASAAPGTTLSTISTYLGRCTKETPDFTMFLRNLESAENGGQKMSQSSMSYMLLIYAIPLTSSELNLNELNAGPAAQDLAEGTMRDAYGQLADQILACLWERRELEAINLLVVCRPFFFPFKVSRPDFSMAEADLREDVTAQLESNLFNTGTYIREKDGKWTFDFSMLGVWEDIDEDVGI